MKRRCLSSQPSLGDCLLTNDAEDMINTTNTTTLSFQPIITQQHNQHQQEQAASAEEEEEEEEEDNYSSEALSSHQHHHLHHHHHHHQQQQPASMLSDKKRRLSPSQLHALEQSFDLDNKLDPDRKLRLSLDLSLQPRQVAVWFQNRRARFKTKQLERDFSSLRSSYDSLKLQLDSLRHQNHILLSDIKELKRKLEEKQTAPAKGGGGGSSDSDTSGIMNEKQKSDEDETKKGIENENEDHQVMRFEEMEEPCSSFFNDEQPPSLLSWYCSADWC